jgi:hypothetical protein
MVLGSEYNAPLEHPTVFDSVRQVHGSQFHR